MKKPDKTRGGKAYRRAFFGLKTLVQLGLIAAIVLVTVVSVLNTADDVAALEAETAAIRLQIERAAARRQEIEDAEAYMQSTRFVEYIARSRLNLVRRDELIFIINME